METKVVLEEEYNSKKELVEAVVREYENDLDMQEDLAQEVWARALEKLPTFDGSSTFSTWLYALAHNVCKNHLRYTAVRSDVVLDSDTVSEEDEGRTALDSYCDESHSPEVVYEAWDTVWERLYGR